MKDYPVEQLQQLYDDLPEDIQEAMFAQENGNIIYNTCLKSGVRDKDKINQVSKLTGYVFLGILPPNELAKNLEEELRLEESTAKQIAWEITQFVFMPIKTNLENLYNIKLSSIEKPAAPKQKAQTPPGEIQGAEKPKKPAPEDTYREPV